MLRTEAARKFLPTGCRRWSCPRCGRRNARRLASRICATPAKRLFTLTWRPQEGVTLVQAIDEINNAWRCLWKRLKRRFGTRARGYVRIIELTKAGQPHLHIAADCPYVSQTWLSKQWFALTGAYIVDVRAITSASGLSRYLAKYLSKPEALGAPRRKFSASRGWLPAYKPAPPPPGELPFVAKWSPADFHEAEAALLAAGWLLIGGWWIDPSVLSRPPP